MTNDSHLRAFAKWPLACRKAFVDDLESDKHVEEMLGKLTYRSIPIEECSLTFDSGPTAHVRKIRRPLEEEWLSDPTKPLEFLLKAMDLPTNRGLFQEMVVSTAIAVPVSLFRLIFEYRQQSGRTEGCTYQRIAPRESFLKLLFRR